MGNDDEGLSETVAQVEEELMELLLVLAVQRTRRFVSQDDGGIVDQRTGNGYALLLTSGEFCGLMCGTVGESHELQQFLGMSLGFLG